MTTRSNNKLAEAYWEGSNLVIDDPAVLKKIRRKEISPSTANNIRKCEASFAADSVLPRASDPFQPFVIGTGAHEAMEHLFQLPPDDRTPDFVRSEVERIRGNEWDPALLTEPDRRTLLLPEASKSFRFDTEVTDELVAANNQAAARWEQIVLPWSLGIFNMTGQPHPRDVDVYATEMAVGGWDFENKRPNPTTLQLEGLHGSFPVQGKIDRTDWVTLPDGSRGLSVRDYKFPSSKPKPPRAGSDDYAEQQRIYTLMFRALHPELPVVDAALLYPGWDHIRPIDVSDEALHGTLRSFELAWLTMNRAADRQKFATKPSNLCGWCPLANVCPVAKITTEKAATSAASKPAGPTLGIRVASPAPRPSAWAKTSDYSKLPGHARQTAKPVHRAEVNTKADAVGTNLERNHQMSNPATVAAVAAYPASEYAAMAVFSVTDTATEHLASNGSELSPTSINALATILAGIVEETTRTLFGGFDWAHGRTSRIVYAVRESIKLRPAPLTVHIETGSGTTTRTGTAEEWAAWRTRIIGLTRAKALTALSLVNTDTLNTDTAIAVFAATSTAVPAAA